MCLTPAELAAYPPHRKEHRLVDYRTSANNASDADAGGVVKVEQGVGSSKGTLALALQVSWPESSATRDGKLVETLQDEGAVITARLEALKVCMLNVFSTGRQGGSTHVLVLGARKS